MVYRRLTKSPRQIAMENFKLNLAIKGLLCATIVTLIVGGALLGHALSQHGTMLGSIQAYYIAGIFFLVLGGLCLLALLISCGAFIYLQEKHREAENNRVPTVSRSVPQANGAPRSGNGEDNPMFTMEESGNNRAHDEMSYTFDPTRKANGQISFVSGKTSADEPEAYGAAPQFEEYRDHYRDSKEPSPYSQQNSHNGRPYRPRGQRGSGHTPQAQIGADPRQQYQYPVVGQPGPVGQPVPQYGPPVVAQPGLHQAPNAYRPRNYPSQNEEEVPMTEYPVHNQNNEPRQHSASANSTYHPRESQNNYSEPSGAYSGRGAAYKPRYSDSDDNPKYSDNEPYRRDPRDAQYPKYSDNERYRGDHRYAQNPKYSDNEPYRGDPRDAQNRYEQSDRYSQQQPSETQDYSQNNPRPYRPRYGNDSPPPSYDSFRDHSSPNV